jgi:hypothetical protein
MSMSTDSAIAAVLAADADIMRVAAETRQKIWALYFDFKEQVGRGSMPVATAPVATAVNDAAPHIIHLAPVRQALIDIVADSKLTNAGAVKAKVNAVIRQLSVQTKSE